MASDRAKFSAWRAGAGARPACSASKLACALAQSRWSFACIPLICQCFPGLTNVASDRHIQSDRQCGAEMDDGRDLIERWRRMAEECRTKGEQMNDPGARS